MSWSCTSLTSLSPNRVEPLSTANIAKDVGSIFIFNFFMWTASLGGLEKPGRAVRISVFEMLFKVCSKNLDPKIWKRPNIRGKQLAWQREQCDDHFWSWAFGYWHAFVWNLEEGDLWQKLSWTTCEAFFIPSFTKTMGATMGLTWMNYLPSGPTGAAFCPSTVVDPWFEFWLHGRSR